MLLSGAVFARFCSTSSAHLLMGTVHGRLCKQKPQSTQARVPVRILQADTAAGVVVDLHGAGAAQHTGLQAAQVERRVLFLYW